MASYYGILEKEEGSLWGVFFPDLPGCVAAGETADEAVTNAIAALRDFADLKAEGGALNPASDLAAVLAHPDVAALVAAGTASPVRIPLLRNTQKQVRANISMDLGMLEAIDAAAKAHGLTRSAFLAVAAAEKIAKAA